MESATSAKQKDTIMKKEEIKPGVHLAWMAYREASNDHSITDQD